MGNGFTTKLRAQWFLDSTLETHNTVLTIPTIPGLIIMLSILVSVWELIREVTK